MIIQNDDSPESVLSKRCVSNALAALYSFDYTDFLHRFGHIVRTMETVGTIENMSRDRLADVMCDLNYAVIMFAYNWGYNAVAAELFARTPSGFIHPGTKLDRFETLAAKGFAPSLPLVSPAMQRIFDSVSHNPGYAESLLIHYQTLQPMMLAGNNQQAYDVYKLAGPVMTKSFSLSYDDLQRGLHCMVIQTSIETLNTQLYLRSMFNIAEPNDLYRQPPDVMTACLVALLKTLYAAKGIKQHELYDMKDSREAAKAELKRAFSAGELVHPSSYFDEEPEDPGEPEDSVYPDCEVEVIQFSIGPRKWPTEATIPMPPSIGNLPLMETAALIVDTVKDGWILMGKAAYGSSADVIGLPGNRIPTTVFDTICSDIKSADLKPGMVFEYSHYWLIKPDTGKIFIRLARQEKSNE